jgi:hypothetical protein
LGLPNPRPKPKVLPPVPLSRDAERQLIGCSDAAHQDIRHRSIPWRLVLTSANVWLLGGVITCSAFNTYPHFSWYPTYRIKGRGALPLTSGWLSSMILASGAIGATLGGFLIAH